MLGNLRSENLGCEERGFGLDGAEMGENNALEKEEAAIGTPEDVIEVSVELQHRLINVKS